MALASDRHFRHMRIHVRPDGERLPLVCDETGVPAYYVTCLLLDARARNLATFCHWGLVSRIF